MPEKVIGVVQFDGDTMVGISRGADHYVWWGWGGCNGHCVCREWRVYLQPVIGVTSVQGYKIISQQIKGEIPEKW